MKVSLAHCWHLLPLIHQTEVLKLVGAKLILLERPDPLSDSVGGSDHPFRELVYNTRFYWSAPLVSCTNRSDHRTESEDILGPLERKHWALRSQKPLRLIMGRGSWGGREFLYLTLTRYTVTTRMILH